MREWGRNPSDLAGRPTRFDSGPDHQTALDKARRACGRNALNRSSFIDLYSPAVVNNDTAYVKERQQIFAREDEENPRSRIMKEEALILQAIIHENGGRWLGDEKITFLKTDDFDDYKNGVDEVVVFPRRGMPDLLALNIDVTFASTIDEKVRRVVAAIKTGELGRIKYLKVGDFRGEKSGIPRAIVGAHSTKLEQLQRMWLNPRADMSVHPFRYFLLEELNFQVEAFYELAKKLGQPKVAEAYEKVLIAVRRCQQAVGPIPSQIKEEIQEDTMVQRIKDEINYVVSANNQPEQERDRQRRIQAAGRKIILGG